jgi:hypothetical protein
MTDKSLKMTRMGDVLRIAKKLYVPMPEASAGSQLPSKSEAEVAQILKDTEREFRKFTRDPHKPEAVEDFHVQRVRSKMYGVKNKVKLKHKLALLSIDPEEEVRITERLEEAKLIKERFKLQLQTDGSIKSGLQSTRMTQSARQSFKTSSQGHKSSYDLRQTPRPGSFLSKYGAAADHDRLDEGSYAYAHGPESLRIGDSRLESSLPTHQHSQIAQEYFKFSANKDKISLQSKLPRTEIIKINDNKGIFFDKIRHYSRIYNPKQKSQLIFEKINKKPQEVEEKKQPRIVQVTVKDFERDINQRLSTFSTFAMSATGWGESRPLTKGIDAIKKKAGISNLKPMTIADLWSKNFHAEIMNKAEHKKFRLRIQRYLHILHRQGQGNASISRLILDQHRDTEKPK